MPRALLFLLAVGSSLLALSQVNASAGARVDEVVSANETGGAESAKPSMPPVQPDVAWLGVEVTPVGDDVAKALRLNGATGALVQVLVPGGPAEVAGVQTGDVILEVGGRAVTDRDDLPSLVRTHRAGDTVVLRVARGLERISLTARLGAASSDRRVRIRFRVEQRLGSCIEPSATMTGANLELTLVAHCIPENAISLEPVFYFYDAKSRGVHLGSSGAQYGIMFQMQASFQTFDTPGFRVCYRGGCTHPKTSVTYVFEDVVPKAILPTVAYVEIALQGLE